VIDRNSNDADKPSEHKSDSDFDKTFADRPSPSLDVKKKNPTTEPQQSPASGLPISEVMMNREIGTGLIIGAIGSGGMGDVYKIWSESLGVHRAIKLMQRCNDPKLGKRFEREIKISAQFDHPNIIRIHATGLWKGYRYLEMEFIDGASLDIWVQKRGKCPPCVCTAVGILASRALTYAHNHTYTLEGQVCKGVVHRDIKPANIMLSKDGKLKVMDFGIARPLGEDVVTLTTGIVGSWPYLPPEQLDGCSVDHRADIYALGAVLYELLTGKIAFPFENQKMFYMNKTRGVYRPIANEGVTTPEALEKIVAKCLEVKPDTRYQTAEELEKALLRIHARLGAPAPESVLRMFAREEAIPLNPEEKHTTELNLLAFWKKQKMLAIAGFAITLLVAGFLIFFGNSAHSGRTSPGAKGTSAAIPDRTIAETIPPKPPQLLSPDNSASGMTLSPNLRWKPDSGKGLYRARVSTRADFSETVIDTSGIADSVLSLSGLLEKTTYHWQVMTTNGVQNSKWSEQFSFTTASAKPPKPARDTVVVREHNWTAIAWKSLDHGRLAEAIEAAEKIAPKNDSLNMKIAEKCINGKDIAGAKRMLTIIPPNDMHAEILRARVMIQENRCADAVSKLDAAIGLQTRFNRQSVQADARYCAAKAFQCLWLQNKAEYREKALDAWREVWKIYKSEPNNPRYKEASAASSLIGREQE
jgi:serine/threonine protein kinase